MNEPDQHTQRAERSGTSNPLVNATLTLCACVLATGLAVAHVVGARAQTTGSRPGAPVVLAQSAAALNGISGMATAGGDVAALTCDGGESDLLLVLDQRSEELLVYRPQGSRALEFVARAGLRELFAEARFGVGLPEEPARPAAPIGPTNPVR
jgi:hypothetical protein